MKTLSQGLVEIRAIASDWLTDQGADGATAMGKVTSVLLDTRFDEAPMLVISSFDDDTASRYLAALEKGKALNIYEGITDPDVIVRLESRINAAEHQPGTWAETRLSMGSVCTKGVGLLPLPKEDSWASFSYKRDSYLAVEAVNALPELISTIRALRERLEVPTDHGTMDGIGTRQAVINVQHEEIQELRAALAEHQKAFGAATLQSAAPEPAENWSADDEARMDVIGQNGNDGAHYDALPEGLSWESAPDWAVALIEADAGNDAITERSIVWVREINTQTIGELALNFSGRKAGAKQSVCMNHPAHVWTIIAVRPKPAPEDGGWINWEGGECPVEDPDQMVWARLEGEAKVSHRPGLAGRWDWSAKPKMGRSRIVAYTLTDPATGTPAD